MNHGKHGITRNGIGSERENVWLTETLMATVKKSLIVQPRGRAGSAPGLLSVLCGGSPETTAEGADLRRGERGRLNYEQA
jgi:hypothetical protein